MTTTAVGLFTDQYQLLHRAPAVHETVTSIMCYGCHLQWQLGSTLTRATQAIQAHPTATLMFPPQHSAGMSPQHACTPTVAYQLQQWQCHSCLRTHLDRLHRERACRCLSRKHDAVCAVQHSIGNVCCFSTCGPRVLDHGLEHLSGGGWFAAAISVSIC